MKISFRIEQLTTISIWLIVTGVSVAYFKYYDYFKTIGEMIVAVAPALIFFTGGILIFSRDLKRIKKAKEKEEGGITVELEWGQAMKHDILTYCVPIVILALPFAFNQIPTLLTVFQAITAFLALSYLKFIYWGEL